MKIVLPGGTGQVGGILNRALTAAGHEVVVLSRRPTRDSHLQWDGRTRQRSARSYCALTPNSYSRAAESYPVGSRKPDLRSLTPSGHRPQANLCGGYVRSEAIPERSSIHSTVRTDFDERLMLDESWLLFQRVVPPSPSRGSPRPKPAGPVPKPSSARRRGGPAPGCSAMRSPGSSAPSATWPPASSRPNRRQGRDLPPPGPPAHLRSSASHRARRYHARAEKRQIPTVDEQPWGNGRCPRTDTHHTYTPVFRGELLLP